jgi:hypothetical protein
VRVASDVEVFRRGESGEGGRKGQEPDKGVMTMGRRKGKQGGKGAVVGYWLKQIIKSLNALVFSNI